MTLSELRKSRGWTQAELAERCGMDREAISRIERGHISPTLATVRRLADALGVDIGVVAGSLSPGETSEAGEAGEE